MKPLLLFTLFLFAGITMAVAGQGINYQAVARNASGTPIVNGTVGLKFTVHADSPSGMVIYQETHVVPTNALGIITVVVGGGTIVTGDMDSIDWAGDKYLQVEYDATGGTSYTDMGATKMMGAPFASYANSANTSLRANVAALADSAAVSGSSSMSLHAVQADNATNATTASYATLAAFSHRADTADLATEAVSSAHADVADNATNAVTAQNAGYATLAAFSHRADTADVASEAVTSAHATTADNALTATNATNAVTATNALMSDHSLLADNATKSDSSRVALIAATSDHALTADNATNATNAVNATNALTSNYSATAGTALRADTATTATTALKSAGMNVYYAESRAISFTPSASLQDKVTLLLQPGTYLITFSAMVGSDHDRSIQYAFDTGNNTLVGTPKVSNDINDYLSVSNTVRETFTVPTTIKIQYNNNQHASDKAYIKEATIAAMATN